MASGLQAHRSDSPSLPGHWATGKRHIFLAQSGSWHPVAKSVDYIDCDSEISQTLLSPDAGIYGQWRSTRIHLATLKRAGFESPLRRVRLFPDLKSASPVAIEESYFLDTESRAGKPCQSGRLAGRGRSPEA